MFIRIIDKIAKFGLPICAGVMGLFALYGVIAIPRGWAEYSIANYCFFIACSIWTVGVITYKIKVGR